MLRSRSRVPWCCGWSGLSIPFFVLLPGSVPSSPQIRSLLQATLDPACCVVSCVCPSTCPSIHLSIRPSSCLSLLCSAPPPTGSIMLTSSPELLQFFIHSFPVLEIEFCFLFQTFPTGLREPEGRDARPFRLLSHLLGLAPCCRSSRNLVHK